MDFVAIAGLSALLMLGLPAQTPPPENICGTVQDQTGAPVAGGKVELSTADNRVDTKTDGGGRFCFDQFESGEYRLSGQARGFRTYEMRLAVHSGQSPPLIITLTLETVSPPLTVSVGSPR